MKTRNNNEREGLRKAIADIYVEEAMIYVDSEAEPAIREEGWEVAGKILALLTQAQEPVAWRLEWQREDGAWVTDGITESKAQADDYHGRENVYFCPQRAVPLYASPVASAPNTYNARDELDALAGAPDGALEGVIDVAGRMKAYGYDAETLRVLTEHIFGGAEIPMPASAPDSDDPNFDTFGDQVALEVLCRVFDEWEPIWDEWLESGRDGFIWWGRALGAFIRKNLRASTPEEARDARAEALYKESREPRWHELSEEAKRPYRLRATPTEEQTDG